MPPANAAAATTSTISSFVARGARARGVIGASSQSSVDVEAGGEVGVVWCVWDAHGVVVLHVWLLVSERFDGSQ